MFDIFNENDQNETDDADDQELGADDPGETEELGDVPLGAGVEGETAPGAVPDPEPDTGSVDGPSTTELEARVEDLEEQLESSESSLRAVRDSQSEISDNIEEMNDTVRRLTGMYDRLAADDNPFVGGPAEDAGTDDAASRGDQTETGHASADGNGSTPSENEGEDDPVVSLEDLREDSGVADSGDNGASAADADAGEQTASEDPDASGSAGRAAPTGGRDEPPTLTSIPDGYAGDVLVMEWLSVLMTESGPCGALRAVEHYEDMGWISSDLRTQLIDVIGGPSLDTSVDPTQFPQEPTAETHAMSHDYLRVLAQLRDL